jgi:hypothetical protein
MRAAVVRRPSSSIYLLEPAECKTGQEIFKEKQKAESREQKGGRKDHGTTGLRTTFQEKQKAESRKQKAEILNAKVEEAKTLKR